MPTLGKLLVLLRIAAALYLYLRFYSQVEKDLKASATLIIGVSICVFLFYNYFLRSKLTSFVNKIMSNFRAFKNENHDIFFEVIDDPTVRIVDKLGFFTVYLIYLIQLPCLYFSMFLSTIFRIQSRARFYENLENPKILVGSAIIRLVNVIVLLPVALLELIKYPLIMCLSPLNLNISKFSLLFNTKDIRGNNIQNVHTRSFEYSIIECAEKLEQEFGHQQNIMDKEFEDYLRSSGEFTDAEIEKLRNFLNFNDSDKLIDREIPKTNLTLTQALNLVLAAGSKQDKEQKDLLKSILLLRLKEGIVACSDGMFNRIIYSFSCVNVANNFAIDIDSHVYGRIPALVEQFLLSCSHEKIKTLKNNFDDFYSEGNLDSNIKNSIDKLMEKARSYVFNELYVDYYERYKHEIKRCLIKSRLKELITDTEIKEAISLIVDGVEVPATYFDSIKGFFKYPLNCF